MFGSEVIDVGIGIALLFLFMSLIATALRELIENFTKTRARDLERGIIELLQESQDGGPGASLTERLYKHPLVASLYKGDYHPGGKDLPSYIPRQNFSVALLDLVCKASETGTTLSIDSLKTSLAQVNPPNPVQRIVLTAIATADNDLTKARKSIEDWYDGTMDRVSGWYARRTARILGVIGLAAAAIFNVDAITVGEHLFQDKSLRQTAVSLAESYVRDHTADGGANQGAAAVEAGNPLDEVNTLKGKLEDIGFPMGWTIQGHWIYPTPQTCIAPRVASSEAGVTCSNSTGWLVALCGWTITALAIMLGAPFWFDVLNKFMVVRSTVKPKEKSLDEASVDRQPSDAKSSAI